MKTGWVGDIQLGEKKAPRRVYDCLLVLKGAYKKEGDKLLVGSVETEQGLMILN